MRTQKSLINAIISIFTYIAILIPTFIVRKVFLTYLGQNWLGVNSLYVNIIDLLSIVELGIGSAIIFSLYKPFADDNREKIKAYLNYYAKFYKKIGTIILVLGLLIVPFLSLFIKDQVNLGEAQVAFCLYLLNTCMTYFFSYKLSLLTVAQEEYKISLGLSISKIVISILQIIMLRYFPNYSLYLIIQLIIQFIYYFIINKYIDKQYNWLSNTKGQLDETESALLNRNIKALFMHKIGNFIVFGTDNLLISYFIDFAAVAKYNSYDLVIKSIRTIINKALSSITASIGNLLVTTDKQEAYIVHKRLFFMNFWVVSYCSIVLYNTLDQFICAWLDSSQILDQFTLILLIFNFYFTTMRGSVERFQDGSGNYHKDRFAPICEALINLVSSVILVNLIGLPGIFLGTLISNITVIFWTKPLVVYKYIFNKKVSLYFKMYFYYLFISLIPLGLTYLATIRIKDDATFFSVILNIIINTIIINGCYILIFRKNKEYQYFRSIIINMMQKLTKKIGGKFK